MQDLDYIRLLFDQKFYSSYYGCKSSLEDYLQDYISQGRYIHKSIIEDNFDYAIFTGKLAWEGNFTINSSLQALYYFVSNKNKYLDWFNNKDLVSHSSRACSTTAIYYCKLVCEKSTAIAIDSINNISDSNILDPRIIVSGVDKNISRLEKACGYRTYHIDNTPWCDLGKHALNYDRCLYSNNKIHIYTNINNVLNSCDHKNILSLTDKYNTISYVLDKDHHQIKPKFFYTINSNFFIFDHNNTNNIIKILSINNLDSEDNINYLVSKYLYSQNISPKFYYKHNINKEIFWHNLFKFDILDQPILIKKYSIPAINISEAIRINGIKKDIKQISNLDVTKTVLKSKSEIVDVDSNKIGCHIHIGNHNIMYIDMIKQTIELIKQICPTIKIHITSFKKVAGLSSTIILPNRGADIGPFLYLLHNNLLSDTDFVVKLHTKTHHGFRSIAYETLINNLYSNIYLLKNSNYSIIGSKNHIMNMDTINKPIIDKFCAKYSIPYVSAKQFFAGTMFMAKTSLFQEFCQKYNIDLIEEYNNLEMGYSQNHEATNTHSWERILSGVVPDTMGSERLCV